MEPSKSYGVWLHATRNQHSSANSQPKLQGLEPLEERTVLSVSAAPLESGKLVEADRDPIIIAAVHLRVGDEEIVLTERNQVVTFDEGEELVVTGIDYDVDKSGEGLEGVVAFEGFLRHASGANYLGDFDYGDGRFGDPSQIDPIAAGRYAHQGLDGGWALEEQVNRLAIAAVRYYGNDFSAEDRFFVNFHPAETDLVMVRGAYRVSGVGREANFYGNLANNGLLAVSTYSEVNIFLASDLTKPVWVGTFEATLQPGQSTGWVEYTNTNPDDGYAERWTADARGTYLVKVFADPEQVLTETDEANNIRSTTFEVR